MSIDRLEPWLTEGALDYINKFININHNILEFGSGSSTTWFAQKCQHILSIEHNKDYYKKILDYIKENNTSNIDIRLINRPYYLICNTLNKNYYDLVLIDGRDRVKCLLESFVCLKNNGILILDNSEREEYQPAFDFMQSYQRFDFKQNGPDKYNFWYPDWMTTIWVKNTI